jgi:hypothetical protein
MPRAKAAAPTPTRPAPVEAAPPSEPAQRSSEEPPVDPVVITKVARKPGVDPLGQPWGRWYAEARTADSGDVYSKPFATSDAAVAGRLEALRDSGRPAVVRTENRQGPAAKVLEIVDLRELR